MIDSAQIVIDEFLAFKNVLKDRTHIDNTEAYLYCESYITEDSFDGLFLATAKRMGFKVDADFLDTKGKRHIFVSKKGEQYGLLGCSGDGVAQPTLWDKIRRFFLTLSQRQENRIRTVMFIDRLKKGDTPEQASTYIYRYLFNYSK